MAEFNKNPVWPFYGWVAAAAVVGQVNAAKIANLDRWQIPPCNGDTREMNKLPRPEVAVQVTAASMLNSFNPVQGKGPGPSLTDLMLATFAPKPVAKK